MPWGVLRFPNLSVMTEVKRYANIGGRNMMKSEECIGWRVAYILLCHLCIGVVAATGFLVDHILKTILV
jgi:hypothetical protein